LFERAATASEGVPAHAPRNDAPIVGIVEYRDGTVIDVIRRAS
jgi:citrate lyase alpha subunit